MQKLSEIGVKVHNLIRVDFPAGEKINLTEGLIFTNLVTFIDLTPGLGLFWKTFATRRWYIRGIA